MGKTVAGVGGKGMTTGKFPAEVAVVWSHPAHDEPYLSVGARAADVMEDDGPTAVAVYRLVRVEQYEKRLTKMA